VLDCLPPPPPPPATRVLYDPQHGHAVLYTLLGICCAVPQALSVWYTKFCADSEAHQVAAIKQHCVPGMAFEDNFIKVGTA
jgi:hypothetical protein